MIGAFITIGKFPVVFAYIIITVIIISTITSLYKLLKMKNVLYTSTSLVVYPNLFNNNAVEIPLENITNVTAKNSMGRIYNRKIFTIMYNAGTAQNELSFLTSGETSIYEIKALLSRAQEQQNEINRNPEPFNINKYQKLDASKRLASAITDHFVMTMVIMVFGLPLIWNTIYTNQVHQKPDIFSWVFIAGLSLYFCKDCIHGQSVAKRLLKQQVVNNKTGQIANPFRCFVRDFFILLFPVEVMAILINPARRIGDKIAGTKVIVFDPGLEKPKISYWEIGVSYLTAFVVAFLLLTFTGTFT